MSAELSTVLLIVAAFALSAWPYVRRALGLGPGIAPDALKARLERGDPTLAVDVREPGETAEGSLPGAVAVPLAQLPSRIPELLSVLSERPETGVVLVCRSGARAERAAVVLAAAGVVRMTVLKGGICAWRKAGYSLTPVSTKT